MSGMRIAAYFMEKIYIQWSTLTGNSVKTLFFFIILFSVTCIFCLKGKCSRIYWCPVLGNVYNVVCVHARVSACACADARWEWPDVSLCVQFLGCAQRHSAGCVGGYEWSEATTQICVQRTPGSAKPADARRRSGGEREGGCGSFHHGKDVFIACVWWMLGLGVAVARSSGIGEYLNVYLQFQLQFYFRNQVDINVKSFHNSYPVSLCFTHSD